MDYELALKLKQAGFPRNIHEYGDFYGEGGAETYVCVPTLEELIEACPKEIDSPNHNKNAKGNAPHSFRLGWSDQSAVGEKDNWFADYEFYESMAEGKYGLPIMETGETPEIAVANLWLALNAGNKENV